MYVAIALAAGLCLLQGVYPQMLYRMLPYPVEYTPYDSWKVLQASLLLEAVLALPLLSFDAPNAGFQFVQKLAWVKAWGLFYYVGVDGISLFMVALTVAIMPLCVLCSWRYIHQRIRSFISAC